MEKIVINLNLLDKDLKKQLERIHAYDLMIQLDEFSQIDQTRIIGLISSNVLAKLFVELEMNFQIRLLERLDDNRKQQLFKLVKSDDLKTFIEDLSEENKEKYFVFLTDKSKNIVTRLLNYVDNTVGAIMDVDFVTVKEKTSIKDATLHVISGSSDIDYIDIIYVVNEENELTGVINLKDLIIARANQELEEITITNFKYVDEHETIEKAIKMIRNYDRNALPVLNSQKQIIGIITGDDVLDEFISEREEDFAKMAMVHVEDESTNPFNRALHRLPWLMVSVILNLLIVLFLQGFNETLDKVAALAFFQPLILGMSGNIGTQSLAVTILGLNIDKFETKGAKGAHIGKEVFVGFINSLIIAIVTFFFAWIFMAATGESHAIVIGVVVSIAIFASLFIAAALGVLTPMLMVKLKVDPAVASGPIITTVIDLLGMLIYFSIATLLLLPLM